MLKGASIETIRSAEEGESGEAIGLGNRSAAAWYYLSSFAAYLGHSLFTYGMIIYAHAMSDSPSFASFLFTALSAPIVALGPYGGVLSDRHPRKSLLLAVQTAACLLLAAFCLETRLDWVGKHRILAAASVFLYGTAIAFTPSPRISLAFDLFSGRGVERATMIVKILNTLAFGCSPFLGGILKGLPGWTVYFMVPAALLALSNLLLAMLPSSRARPSQRAGGSARSELRQGFAYIAGNPVLLQIFLLCACVYTSLLGPYQVLIPAFAKGTLKLDEYGRGLFLTSFGAGLLLGGIAATFVRTRRGRYTLGCAVLSACFFLGVASTGRIWVAAVGLAGSGFFGGAFGGLAPSALQVLVRDELRGRVMSVYYVLLAGTPALGGLVFGIVAKHGGARAAILSAGAFGLSAILALAKYARSLRRYA